MDKKHILIMSTLITCILISLPHHLKMLDIFPANDSALILFALFVPLLLSYDFSGVLIIIDSQLVDVVISMIETDERSKALFFLKFWH